jgi:hypothetical protein
MTHDELVKIAVRWLKRSCVVRAADWHKGGCGVAVPELVTYNGEIPDAIGWVANGYSYAIECKTSLADFRADFKKNRHRIPDSLYVGAQCLYLCPEGVISPADVPAPWGLLYANERGKVNVVSTPLHNPRRNITGEMALMYGLLRRVEIHGNLRACLSPKWGGINPLVSTGPGDSNG